MAALLRSAKLVRLIPALSRQIGQNTTRLACSSVVSAGKYLQKPQFPHSPRFLCTTLSRPQDVTEQQEVQRQAPSRQDVRQVAMFEQMLRELDFSVRRTGRIVKSKLERVFNATVASGQITSKQALLLLRSCTMLSEETRDSKLALMDHMWNKMAEMGAKYDVSHYNAQLKIYLDIEHKFSATDFLANMEAKGIHPNRVTYQHLVTAYCQQGDIEGARKVLEFMKTKDFPITEAVFNALITGHSRAGDMENAKGILDVMRNTGVEPSLDTYTALLCAFAEHGDIPAIEETIAELEKTETSLMDSDHLQLVYSLATHGHSQHVPTFLEKIRHDRGYVQDAIITMSKLIIAECDDAAFQVFLTLPRVGTAEEGTEGDPNNGYFFIRNLVYHQRPIESLVKCCDELQERGIHTVPLQFALKCALEDNNAEYSYSIIKVLKEKDLPLRPHYFWPLLATCQEDSDAEGVMDILKNMQELGVPPDGDTYSKYFLTLFDESTDVKQKFQELGWSLGSDEVLALIRWEIQNNRLDAACTLLKEHEGENIIFEAYKMSLMEAFMKRQQDPLVFADLLDIIFKTQQSDRGEENDAVGYFLYNLLEDMWEGVAKRREETFHELLVNLNNKGVRIPVNIVKGMDKFIRKHKYSPEVFQAAAAMADGPLNDRGERDSMFQPDEEGEVKVDVLDPQTIDQMENQLNAARSRGQSRRAAYLMRILIKANCLQGNIARALDLKTEMDSLGEILYAVIYPTLIEALCKEGKVQEAWDMNQEFNRHYPSFVMNPWKYCSLVQALAENGRLQDALSTMDEMKAKGILSDFQLQNNFFLVLQRLAEGGDLESTRALFDKAMELGLLRPTSNLASNLITPFLLKDDLEGAWNVIKDCQEKYRILPRLHDVLCAYVEKGDTDNLQTAMDYISNTKGEMNMLYDLVFAFLAKGKYKEARKIIETPGMRSLDSRINWFANLCIQNNMEEALEQLVVQTKKLFGIDRDVMYTYLLQYYDQNQDGEKAAHVWTMMQEEDLLPKDSTLRLIANILHRNGQPQPADFPDWITAQEDTSSSSSDSDEDEKRQSVYWRMGPRARPQQTAVKDNAMEVEAESKASEPNPIAAITRACSEGDADAANEALAKAEAQGVPLSITVLNKVLSTNLARGQLEEAEDIKNRMMAKDPEIMFTSASLRNRFIITYSVKGRMQDAIKVVEETVNDGKTPSVTSVRTLLHHLTSSGNVEGIRQLSQSLDKLKTVREKVPVYSIDSYLFHALLNSNQVEEACNHLESIMSESEGKMRIVYPLMELLEKQNDAALDRVSATIEKVARFFNRYNPVVDLFLAYVNRNNMEEARHQLERFPAIEEEGNIIVGYAALCSQKKDTEALTRLMEVLPGFGNRKSLHYFLLRAHYDKDDVDGCWETYQGMLTEGIELDVLSQKRLAQILKKHGREAPFEEPPESFAFYKKKLDEMRLEASS